MSSKNITISDGGIDNGWGRYNAYEGREHIVSTNSLDELLDGVREFLTSSRWEPDYETEVEEMPAAQREKAIMETGMIRRDD